MKKGLLSFIICIVSFCANAQSGYEITINLKNCKDTLAYLTFYQMDKTMIKDTCTTIKNGKIVFKGKGKLDKGIYSLVSQQKSICFDFFIDDATQKLEISSDAAPDKIINELTAVNNPRENTFFEYVRFITKQKRDFQELKQRTILKTKKDTLDFNEKQAALEKTINTFEEKYLAENKGTYIGDVFNLKVEKVLKEIPKASNGRPDSLKVYQYYKDHYWENVNFKDDGIMRNPFFFNKLKKYFTSLVPVHPDSVSVEIDKIMAKTVPGTILNKVLLAHFTYTYETSEIMGFDKVFVHMSDQYFKTGKAVGVYEDENIAKIIKRADKLKPLLIGAPAQELYMIKAEDFDKMKAMGFENAKNSEEMTNVFYAHQQEVNKLFLKLSDVKAKYTLLIFWDVDCSHCQKEIPKLLDQYNELIKQHKDIKVYSVYMQHEGEKYLKYIAEHKLPWINVYDGAHYNNAIEKYDVYSTPVFYLLDQNKVIKAKRFGADQLGKIVETIEKETK
ncbi:redoxin domain-containing protein [Flavobacterium sp. XGLA_31]|uniref:redoxin domain-containing protein n=1 Tax=Flavobacterium sp. XGLA_31 TaxID=3447666 RepID=UPI003F2D966C